ncbi:hypothetical protein ACF0H5_008712 [Mactra antiquata]
MASSSLLKQLEETFEYICTSCAEDNLIKEALKYCVDCQKYCCEDCLTSHRRFSVLKGHSFLDNSSVKPQGQSRSLPAFPSKQCRHHFGKILDIYCPSHDVVCCSVCVGEGHKLCKDMMSVTDNIDQLYNKTDTSKVTSELSDTLDTMTRWQAYTNTLLQQLQDSKVTAIKAVSDCRVEMEKFLKKLEETSMKEIENEYTKLESQILKERKRFEDSIDDLKNLKQLMEQSSGNIAQLFVCSKLAEKKCTNFCDEMKRKRFEHAEVKFVPSGELKSMKHLGQASAISSRKYNIYKATKICDMNVKVKEDTSGYNCDVHGSCIIDDTVIFTDCRNNKLKRYDMLSSSLIDYCDVPAGPYGVCRVGDKQVALACQSIVQFVSLHDKLSLSHSIKMKHSCYGIAHSNDKLYITDWIKSLYLYDMSGKLLKKVSRDNSGQPLSKCSKHITFNDKNDRLFVCNSHKGLVCLNTEGDYIETITDPVIGPSGVCIDGYGNVIVASNKSQVIHCDGDGQKCGIIVNTSQQPQCVCIHHGLRKMFIGYPSNTVEVYNLTWKTD